MNDKKIIDLFKDSGFLFPETDEEVERFEKNFSIDKNDTIYSFNNPLRIIKNGYKNMKNIHMKTGYSQDISMAARDGKNISEATLKKMQEDKNSARKK